MIPFSFARESLIRYAVKKPAAQIPMITRESTVWTTTWKRISEALFVTAALFSAS